MDQEELGTMTKITSLLPLILANLLKLGIFVYLFVPEIRPSGY